jgi:hypothetical protein
MTRSASITVDSRCAITIRVALSARVLSMTVRWVSLSSALVASSKKRMRGRRISAWAIIRRWRWPPEIAPLPETMVCSPIGIRLMSSARPAISAAAIASSGVYGSVPQMQSRIEPVNGCACWSTTPH